MSEPEHIPDECPWCGPSGDVQVRNPAFGISAEPSYRCLRCGKDWVVKATTRAEDLKD